MSRRHRFRDFYELTRVAAFPHYTKESQSEVETYFWESSLSDAELTARRNLEIEREADKKRTMVYNTGQDVLNLFKSASKVIHG